MLKLVGMVEGMGENVLAKDFLGSINTHQNHVGGPQEPLLGHGDEIETPNWPCRGHLPRLGQMKSTNLLKVARSRSVDNKCLFYAMEM